MTAPMATKKCCSRHFARSSMRQVQPFKILEESAQSLVTLAAVQGILVKHNLLYLPVDPSLVSEVVQIVPDV